MGVRSDPLPDEDCTALLKWALPRAGLHWPGFRRVRGQVCKRLKRRVSELGLGGFAAYRAHLESHPDEWHAFDACCHVTISRLFRDRGVFETLRGRVLPAVATRAAEEDRQARIWSAGCASGEEPYTLRIIWDLEIGLADLVIVATDIDPVMLARAREGSFPASSLRELPTPWREQAFDRSGAQFRVKPRHRHGIDFRRQDLRCEVPPSVFDVILCRNLAFTYFAPAQQREALSRMRARLRPHGWLVIGSHEALPDMDGFAPLPGTRQILTRMP